MRQDLCVTFIIHVLVRCPVWRGPWSLGDFLFSYFSQRPHLINGNPFRETAIYSIYFFFVCLKTDYCQKQSWLSMFKHDYCKFFMFITFKICKFKIFAVFVTIYTIFCPSNHDWTCLLQFFWSLLPERSLWTKAIMIKHVCSWLLQAFKLIIHFKLKSNAKAKNIIHFSPRKQFLDKRNHAWTCLFMIIATFSI